MSIERQLERIANALHDLAISSLILVFLVAFFVGASIL